MARVHELKIKNFRGINNFSHIFNNTSFLCLVGRGDSGKSTILEAIFCVLSSRWNLTFYDNDFYNCDISTPIEIEVTLIDLPEKLIHENKYGLYIRGVDRSTNEIHDELQDHHEKALTIRLEVKNDLEPKWHVINNRNDSSIPISSYDRGKLNVFLISDYIDRHFSWSKGAPLYSLLKQQQDLAESNGSDTIIDAIREAKAKIDKDSFKQFKEITDLIIKEANGLGINISNASTSIDFRDISVKEGKVCLHDEQIPFRLKGKGSKRLISIAIQSALVEKGGIILIDEIEQGLEPDRVKHLVRTLENTINGQVFITTHSQNVIEELDVQSLLKVDYKSGNTKLINCDETFQMVIRACPEAAFAKKVIVCEEKTEIGICRALDLFRILNGKSNFSSNNVVYTLGSGDSFIERAIKLKKLNLTVCVLCDSDKDDQLNPSKENLKEIDIQIFDCEHGNAFENQLFNDLPWEAIQELIISKEMESSARSIEDSIKSEYNNSLPANWKKSESIDLRKALGRIAKRKDWYKRIDRGEYLGNVIFKYFDEIRDKSLGKLLANLSKWIEIDH